MLGIDRKFKMNNWIGKKLIIMALVILQQISAVEAADFAGPYPADYDQNFANLGCCSEIPNEVCCVNSAPSCGCYRFFVSADLLYWRAFEDGLDRCGVGEFNEFLTEENGIVSLSRRKRKDPHFEWNAGYRVGIGALTPCCWDIAAYWTSFNTKAHLRQNREQEFVCEETSDIPRACERSHWKLDYDTIDLIIGRNFSFCACELNLRPYLGVRGAKIKQRLRDCAENIVDLEEELNFVRTFERNRQTLEGVGPFLGLQGDWNIGCNFSVFGCLDFGFLYGRFDIRSRNSEVFINDISCCNVKRNLQACSPFVDVVLGLRWRYCFCNCMPVTIQISGEHHRYFDHNRIGGEGDLCLDGGTLSAGIEF